MLDRGSVKSQIPIARLQGMKLVIRSKAAMRPKDAMVLCLLWQLLLAGINFLHVEQEEG